MQNRRDVINPYASRIFFCLGMFFCLTAKTMAAGQAIAMHGEPKYPAGFVHFDYVYPEAPKGGELRLGEVGSFNSVHPFIISGDRAEGLGRTFQSLLKRSRDEAFSLYAGLAETAEMSGDRRQVRFSIDPRARFHDGSSVTPEDVKFSWEILKAKGRPNHRYYYAKATAVSVRGRDIIFDFGNSEDRELPLIFGLMPVLSKADFEHRAFDKATLTPLNGSGPYRIAGVEPGRSIRYERIVNHWAENIPTNRGQFNFASITHEYFRDEATAYEAFKAGRLDFWEEGDPGRWASSDRIPAVAAGRVIRAEIPHERPSGMYALVFNSRRAPFHDIRFRKAIIGLFDHDWVNRNFFHGQYHRTRSFFDNSPLSAGPNMTREERDLLVELRVEERQLDLGNQEPRGRRERLRLARQQLLTAGYRVKDLKLLDPEGRPVRFEITLVRRQREKLALTFARSLARLGVEVKVRLVDSSQYHERSNNYDFDAIFYDWGLSLSPGNEQAFYWGSAGREQPGTRNYPGIADPAIDRLIPRLTRVADLTNFQTAVRLLDRLLLSGHYMLPLFHSRSDRVLYSSALKRPARTPLYGYSLSDWWFSP